jgi:WD40 repeat protein
MVPDRRKPSQQNNAVPTPTDVTGPYAEPCAEPSTPSVAAATPLPAMVDCEVLSGAITAVQPQARASAAVAVPGYEVLGELGRGGMGVVYAARQINADRVVALKMLLAGGHAGDALRGRFKVEAEAIARLQHPNIVQVFEVGEKDGLAFFSLEFCPGGTLAERLRGGPLTPAAAAPLVETLARAIHAAHTAHVLHRDLKPANVLLAGGGRDAPLERLTPKVSDFGLARKLDVEGPTYSGDILGTPAYMAPEQAAGQTREQGPAVDVYALGVLLYECLTGRPPFRAATVLETLQQVEHAEPVAVRRLAPAVPRDLETICHKCLQKEPRKRYASAAALADDLRRFQRGEPIHARPVGRLERTIRWCRRYPAVTALLALLAIALAGTLERWHTAIDERDLKEAARASAAAEQKSAQESAIREGKAADQARLAAEAERTIRGEKEQVLGRQSVLLADQYWQSHNADLARETLGVCPPELRSWEWRYLARLCGNVRIFRDGGAVFESLAVSPDGTRLAAAGAGAVKVWNTHDGTAVFALPSGPRAAAISPDCRRVAVSALPNEEKADDIRQQVAGFIHELGGERVVHKLIAPFGNRVTRFVFSPDGKTLAGYIVNFPSGVRLWDAATGAILKTLGDTDNTFWMLADAAFSPNSLLLAGVGRGKAGHDELNVVAIASGKKTLTYTAEPGQNLVTVAFSPNGKRLAIGGKPLVPLPGQKGVLKVWDLETGEEVKDLPPADGGVSLAAFNPDGRLLAVVDAANGAGRVIDLEQKGAVVLSLGSLQSGHEVARQVLAFTDDGKLLTAGGGYEPRLWDLATKRETRDLRNHAGAVTAVAFGANGHLLASAGRDQTVRLWDLTVPPNPQVLRDGQSLFTSAVLSPDGELTAAAGYDPTPGKTIKGTITLWKTATGERVRVLAGHESMILGLAFGPDGSRIASAAPDRVIVWDPATGAEVLSFRGHNDTPSVVKGATAAAFSPDGNSVASTGRDGTVQIWDARTGDVQSRWKDEGTAQRFGHCVTFAGKGARLAVGFQNDVKVFDVQGRRVLSTIPQGVIASHGATLALSPDGAVLASIYGLGSSAPDAADIHGWDTATGKPLFSLRGHLGGVSSVAFSPDGTRLASTGLDGMTKFWDMARRQDVLTLRPYGLYTASAAFSRDGRRLVTVHTPYANPGGAGEVRVWDARPLAP